MEFTCSKPKPDMIRHWVPILPEHIWSTVCTEAGGERQSNTNNPPYVGSGPFTAEEWKKTSHVKMVANPTWWGPKPKIDEIYFMAFTNNDTLLQDLIAGTIDGGVDLNGDADASSSRAMPTSPSRAITVGRLRRPRGSTATTARARVTRC